MDDTSPRLNCPNCPGELYLSFKFAANGLCPKCAAQLPVVCGCGVFPNAAAYSDHLILAPREYGDTMDDPRVWHCPEVDPNHLEIDGI